MKKIISFIFILWFSSFNLYSQDGVDSILCDFKIVDNQIICSGYLFTKCPHEFLKESQYRTLVQANEGEEKTEVINFKKIEKDSFLKNKSEKEIILFKNDFRAEKINVVNNLKLKMADLSNYIKLTFLKEGEKISVTVGVVDPKKSTVYLELPKDEKNQQIIFLNETQITMSCEKINKRIFGDLNAEKEAVKKYSEKFYKDSSAKSE